jgi:hypothetical protein
MNDRMRLCAGAFVDPGSVILLAAPLPSQAMTISNVFPDRRVVFPFSKLTSAARQALSTCFGS